MSVSSLFNRRNYFSIQQRLHDFDKALSTDNTYIKGLDLFKNALEAVGFDPNESEQLLVVADLRILLFGESLDHSETEIQEILKEIEPIAKSFASILRKTFNDLNASGYNFSFEFTLKSASRIDIQL